MRYALAIDIGASSGRHIVGWPENGSICTREVYRFPNGVKNRDGHLVWDTEALLTQVKAGIEEALRQYPHIETLSIDTWGVDYVLLRGEEEVLPVYAYRDDRTREIIPGVHEKIPFRELYHRTGCQFQPFNSLYQLCADQAAGRLEGVTDFLMIPEYLMYKLCGVKAKEFTNATTMGMVNADTLDFDHEIVARLGLPPHLFPKLQQPGTCIGSYRGIRVLLCATHDTGSAVEGIPMEGNQLYLSSGTWSLLGVKTYRPLTDEASRKANYSNEGGVNCNRYQKNIMGMWLINELRRDLCPAMDFGDIVREAEASKFEGLVDANGEEFLAPEGGMKAAFDKALERNRGRGTGSEETDSEQIKPAGTGSEETDSEQIKPAGTESEETDSEQIESEETASEQNDPEGADPEGTDSEGSEPKAPEPKAPEPEGAEDPALPLSVGDYFRCAYRSLAACYGEAVRELEDNTGRRYDRLYIVGGGAKNHFLNRLTEETTGKEVVALPIEATALGNLKIQLKGEIVC